MVCWEVESFTPRVLVFYIAFALKKQARISAPFVVY